MVAPLRNLRPERQPIWIELPETDHFRKFGGPTVGYDQRRCRRWGYSSRNRGRARVYTAERFYADVGALGIFGGGTGTAGATGRSSARGPTPEPVAPLLSTVYRRQGCRRMRSVGFFLVGPPFSFPTLHSGRILCGGRGVGRMVDDERGPRRKYFPAVRPRSGKRFRSTG